MPKARVHPLLRFYTNKRVVIEDARLGLLLWGLRGFLLWFYLNDLINNQGHLDISNVDSAKANFWANIGTLYHEQAKSQGPHTFDGWTSADDPWNGSTGYCNGQHWALPAECKTSSSNGETCWDGTGTAKTHSNCNGIFCELDWQCVASDFSQLNIKGEQMMSFITANKDYKKTVGSCSDITSSVCTNQGEVWEQLDNGYQCACIKLENQFNVGVEGMTLNFQHMFTPSAKSGIKPPAHNVCGAKDVRMSLWTTDVSGRVSLVKKFELGKPAKYPVREWLKMVGVNSLDDVNLAANQGGFDINTGRPGDTVNRVTDTAKVGKETFRMTGVGIGIDFIWGGDMREEDGHVFPSPPSSSCSSVQLHVKARLIPGWQSLGSEVHYSDRTEVIPTQSDVHYKNTNDYPIREKNDVNGSGGSGFKTMTYHDRYKRGVKFEFTYHGKLGHFDAMAFVTRVSSFIVLLGVAEAIVSMLAFSLMGYKSKVYKRGRDDVMHIEREHAKIAVSTLTAAATFRALTQKDEKMLHWSEIRDFLQSFEGISAADAAKLATRVLEEGDLDRDGGLSLEEFTNLLTEESGMLHQCIEHLDYEDPSRTLGDLNSTASKFLGFKSSRVQVSKAEFGDKPAEGAADGGAPGRVQAMNAHGMIQLHAVVPPNMLPGQSFKVGTPDGRIMQVVVPPNHAPGSTFAFCVPPTMNSPMLSVSVQPNQPQPLGGNQLVNALGKTGTA